LDHDELFRQAERIQGKLLMTYDNDEEVKGMALRHGFETGLISMMNTHHATMQELIIGHDLAWSTDLTKQSENE
jgi:DNA adenine methylase